MKLKNIEEKPKLIEIERELNHIRFAGCASIYIGDVLHFSIKAAVPINLGARDIALSLYSIIKYSMLKRYSFQVYGTGKTLFLFSDSYSNRKDHIRSFNKVRSIVRNRIDVIAEKKNIGFLDSYTIGICFLWFLQMRRAVPGTAIRLRLVSELYHAYIDDRYIRRIIRKKKLKPELLVSLSDVHLIDSFITQRMNLSGVKTVTLQHGAVMDTWGVKHFKSKNMLAISQFTIDAAKKAHAGKIKKMIPVGLMAYADEKKEPPEPDRHNIQIIGVFLDDERAGMKEINLKMISIVQEYAIETGKKVICRLHPFTDPQHYKHILHDNICDARQSLSEFMAQIDVGIVHDSTVLLEGLYIWKPMVMFDFKSVLKHYISSDIDVMCFQNTSDLRKIIGEIEMGKKMITMRRERTYFCNEGAVYNNFKRAFELLGAE